ncbi:hypothetical protein ACWPM1_13370 [Tsuneonella sp. HG249]
MVYRFLSGGPSLSWGILEHSRDKHTPGSRGSDKRYATVRTSSVALDQASRGKVVNHPQQGRLRRAGDLSKRRCRKVLSTLFGNKQLKQDRPLLIGDAATGYAHAAAMKDFQLRGCSPQDVVFWDLRMKRETRSHAAALPGGSMSPARRILTRVAAPTIR